ncbi:MAG: hypothetical protein AAF727_00420 [Pseudomonadota bacterium]
MAKGCSKGSTAPGDTPLAALDVDPVEYGFLNAARFFCLSFSEPCSGAWVTALLGAPSFFPGDDSAETMRCALAVVHEMRTSRRSTFRFSNPRCEACAAIVTEHERHLVQMVQHARAGRGSMMASSAMLLCEGHDTARVCAAAQGFASHVGAPQRARVVV